MANFVHSTLAWLHGALAALHGPVSTLWTFIGDVFANRMVPAGQAVLYTVVPLAIAWAVLKIVKKVK